MIDPRAIVDDPEAAKAALRRRNEGERTLASVDRIVALASERSALLVERDTLRARRNDLSGQIGALYKAGKKGEAEAMKAEVAAGTERTKVVEDRLLVVENEQTDELMRLPNPVRADVPDGKNENDNVELRRWGTPRVFDFEPKAHVEVGEALGIVDLDRGAKLTGARFWTLRGLGARLERALWNFFLDLHTTEHGLTEVLVPAIVHRQILEGTSQLPKFEQDLFRLADPLNGSDAFLVPTAEVPVTNLHRDEILDETALPLKYAAFTPCFRAEAGAHGREVRGLLRVHQFHKVEMVAITTPETSEAMHEQMVGWAEVCLQRLGLPYRVEVLCGGDIGFGSSKTYDVEVWLPSLNGFKEISSVSNCGDFQARRMALRYRPDEADGKKGKPRLCHTLNGSGLAVGRTVVAILENFQEADGSVTIPPALRPYMGGVDAIRKA